MDMHDQPILLVRDRLEQRQVQVSAAGGGGAGQRKPPQRPRRAGRTSRSGSTWACPFFLNVEIGDDAAGVAAAVYRRTAAGGFGSAAVTGRSRERG